MIHSERIQRDFPSLKGKAYLNTAAEGIPPPQAGAALQKYWEDKLLGMDGREAHFRVEGECRAAAADMLGLSAAEVSFCSCSSEAYNLLANALGLGSGDEIVLNDLDYPSGATPWLAARAKPRVALWKSAGGALRFEDLEPLLTEKTRLVQVSLVSFYNGYRLPWKPLSELVRRLSPQAILSVDLTQALGRCVLDCSDADFIVSSTHKWALGIHGGCVVGVPARSAGRLTTRAGGWYNLVDPFRPDRFDGARSKPGAPGFSVGMPSFAPIYALNAGLRYLAGIGVAAIADHADPLVEQAHAGLVELGISPLAPLDRSCRSGIVAFRHAADEQLHRRLHSEGVHVMQHAGRLRIAVHGYNTGSDIGRFLQALKSALKQLP